MQERIYFDLSDIYQNLYQLDESYQEVEIDSDDVVVDYLISEGYTKSVEDAEVILSNMSEEWYNFIIEKSTSEKISDLRKVMDTELKSIDTKNPNPKQVKKIQHLRGRIKTLDVHRKGEEALEGPNVPTRISQKAKEAKSEPLSPEDRKALRDTRSVVPSGSPEQRAATRAGISARKVATRGTTPQSSGMNLAPVTTRTSAQRRAAATSDAMVGNLDPTFVNREGKRQRLTSQGESERTYAPGTSARYQQSATGSGTRGATPAGSTIDPDRPRTRGQGRRPNG